MLRTLMAVAMVAMLGACAAPAPLEFHPNNLQLAARRQPAEVRAVTVRTAPQAEQIGKVDWWELENTIGNQLVITSTGTGIPVTLAWESAIRLALDQTLIFPDNAPRKMSLVVDVQRVERIGLITVTYAVAARYRLLDRETGVEAYSQTIDTTGAAEVGEAYVGAVRARLAFVRAVQANIDRFLAIVQVAALK